MGTPPTPAYPTPTVARRAVRAVTPAGERAAALLAFAGAEGGVILVLGLL